MKCPSCKSERFSPVDTKIEYAFKAITVSAPTSGDKCEQCDEILLDDAALGVAEAFAAGFLVATGASGGDVFKFLRKQLRISAKDVAGLLDVAYETVLRWEKGERDVPRAEMALLGSLVDDMYRGQDNTRDRLMRMGEPTLRPPRESFFATIHRRSSGEVVVSRDAIDQLRAIIGMFEAIPTQPPPQLPGEQAAFLAGSRR